MKKRSASNKGWWHVALEIWEERQHACVVCQRNLGDVPQPEFFSHLLPRGSYRKYKLDKRNIQLKCAEHHDLWHKHGPANLITLPEWKAVCVGYYQLRDEANDIKP
jgi:hypothetical protein